YVSFSLCLYYLHSHSFPTRRSSDLTIEFEAKKTNKVSTKDTNQQLYTTDTDAWFEFKEKSLTDATGTYSLVLRNLNDGSIFQRRSEEHTSELQSRFDLVCRLLLEKK